MNEIIACDFIQQSKSWWYFTHKIDEIDEIDFNQTIKLNELHSIISTLKLDQYLKRIYLGVDFNKKEVSFSFLNIFNKLDYLALAFNPVNLKTDQILNLPNLRFFQLIQYDYTKSTNYKIKLISPKLIGLACSNNAFEFLELDYSTNNVVHLSIGKYSTEVEQFKNLEILKCDSIEFDNPLNKKLLSILFKLKELHLNFEYSSDSRKNISIQDVKRAIYNPIISFRQQSYKNRSIQIYLNGVQFDHNVDLDISFGLNVLAFQFNYYDQLHGDLSFVKKVRYDDLLKLINKISNVDLFMNSLKFFNIEIIEIFCAVDQNQLINFIKNLKYLKALYLFDANFDQNFYNQLPNFCKLTILQIIERDYYEDNIDLGLNFNFIFKFDLLNLFTTNQNIPFDLVVALFLRFKNLDSFNFKNNGYNIRVRKKNVNEYVIKVFSYKSELEPKIQKLAKNFQDLMVNFEEISNELKYQVF